MRKLYTEKDCIREWYRLFDRTLYGEVTTAYVNDIPCTERYLGCRIEVVSPAKECKATGNDSVFYTCRKLVKIISRMREAEIPYIVELCECLERLVCYLVTQHTDAKEGSDDWAAVRLIIEEALYAEEGEWDC